MRPRAILAMAIVAALGFAAPVEAGEPTAAGLWEQAGGKGHGGGWFFIFEKDGVYEGALVKMFVKPGEDPNPICTACSGDQKDQPTLGLIMIRNMQRDGRDYRGGTILDPRDGKVYDAVMEVSEDGRKLKLRGYVAIPLFGETELWRRLPDDALSPSEVPKNLAPYWRAARAKTSDPAANP
jgi:uncharacterized protein (DUF2147 family)